jgi:hypothetical protein
MTGKEVIPACPESAGLKEREMFQSVHVSMRLIRENGRASVTLTCDVEGFMFEIDEDVFCGKAKRIQT